MGSLEDLAEAVRDLAAAVEPGRPATQKDLKKLEKRIMSAISDFSASVNLAFGQIGQGVDVAVAGVAGVASDVAHLKGLIEQLNASAGSISAEDQALLDAALLSANDLVNRVSSVSSSLSALDAQTEVPPMPPA